MEKEQRVREFFLGKFQRRSERDDPNIHYAITHFLKLFEEILQEKRKYTQWCRARLITKGSGIEYNRESVLS